MSRGELAEDLLDLLRRVPGDDLAALIDVNREVVALLKHEHWHAQVRGDVIELVGQLLDRVADEDRRVDLLAFVLCSDVLEHARDLGGAGSHI